MRKVIILPCSCLFFQLCTISAYAQELAFPVNDIVFSDVKETKAIFHPPAVDVRLDSLASESDSEISQRKFVYVPILLQLVPQIKNTKTRFQQKNERKQFWHLIKADEKAVLDAMPVVIEQLKSIGATTTLSDQN